MTEDEAYKVHIQYTFNAFCKIVIRHAAIDKILKLRRRWEREVSLDYLMNEKFVQLAEPEQLEEFRPCRVRLFQERHYHHRRRQNGAGTGSGSRCYTGADLSGVNRGMRKAAMPGSMAAGV